MSLFTVISDSLLVKSESNSEDMKLCRICVEKCIEMQNILKDNDKECLSQYFGVIVQESDSWPKTICKACQDEMIIAVRFIVKIRNSEKLLYGLLGALRQIPVKPEIEIVDVKESQKKCEEDLNSDDSSSANDSQSLQKDFTENLSSNEEDSRSDPLSTSAREDIPERSPESTKSLRCDKERREQQLSRIEEFFRMDCEICGRKCSKLKELQAHFRQEHQQKAFVVCCKSKFRHRCKIEEHMELHLNPDAFKCVECGKVSRTKYNLHLHMKNSHTPKEFHKFMCEKCPATFMTMERFKKHAFVHLPEDKKANKCPKCSKALDNDARVSK